MKIEASSKRLVRVDQIPFGEAFSYSGVLWCVVDYFGVFARSQALEKMVVCLNLSTGVLGAFETDAKVEYVPEAKLVV